MTTAAITSEVQVCVGECVRVSIIDVDYCRLVDSHLHLRLYAKVS